MAHFRLPRGIRVLVHVDDPLSLVLGVLLTAFAAVTVVCLVAAARAHL